MVAIKRYKIVTAIFFIMKKVESKCAIKKPLNSSCPNYSQDENHLIWFLNLCVQEGKNLPMPRKYFPNWESNLK